MRNNIGCLTHYTTIESLEKILESQSFKFNSAKNLNDKLEGKSLDSDVPMQYIMYSSSWCGDTSEQGIEYMWDNYAKADKGGVRIFAPKYIFKKYTYSHQINKPIETHLPDNYHEKFLPSDRFSKHLYPIEYTDDLSKTLPNITSKDKHWTQHSIFELGKYKEKKWEVEREWRYNMFILHRGLISIPKEYKSLAIQQHYPECIYLKFKYSVYKKMLIQLNKNCNDEYRNKLHQLSKRYKFTIIN